jgi:hypothetical protein
MQHGTQTCKAREGRNLSDEERNRIRGDKLEEASVNAATEGLKALLLLNGFACVAILGFLASTMGKNNLYWEEQLFVRAAMKSLVAFSISAGFAVGVSVCAHQCNQRYAEHLRWPVEYPRSWTFGARWERAGMVLVALSLIGYLVGVGIIAATLL